jgi:D-beta-D-heptose 7-phosphate kinase/D-beta-D-heptose 1-phosphate adenosyltransferase
MSALADHISRLAGRRVAVIGDVMLDHFVIGRVDRISPEAPVPVVRLAREEYRLGGAANVAHNLQALGAHVALAGVVGDDESARELCRQLRLTGLSERAVVTDATRPTTRKMRVVTTRNQQVARVDQEHDADVAGAALDALMTRIEAVIADSDAVVLSDYRKGVVSDGVIVAAARWASHRGVPLLVDPKVARAERYRGVTVVTPNHHEAEIMTRRAIRTNEDAREAARQLHEQTGASVLITRGEHGMWVLDTRAAPPAEAALPAMAREVADVTGAGDTVIAVLALAMASGAGLVDAARLANIAAGLVVARFGPATVSPDELAEAAAAS